MSDIAYLIFHKDHPVDIDGVNSGAEMATLCLARALAARGQRVVMCGQFGTGDREQQGIEYWDLGQDFNVEQALQRARSLGRYHLITACRAYPILASRSEAHCLSRWLIGHDPSAGATGIEPAILGRVCDGIICVSEAQKNLFLEHGADSECIHVVPNGADLDLFSAGAPEGRDFHRLVFAGSLVPHKGIDLLIGAFARLRTHFPDLTLDVYGDASLWGQENYFDLSEVERNVPGIHFHGAVDQYTVAQAFQTAGVCVIPSRWFDSFPLTAVEAQVSGCPVVGFNVGGIREAIIDGTTGVLIEQVEVDALYETLNHLLSNTARLSEMSHSALQHARSRYSWDKTAGEIESLCEAVVDATVTERGKIGFLSTWNQPCGLATYGKYLVGTLTEDTFVVLAEDTPEADSSHDASYVHRCWKGESDSYAALEEAVRANNVRLIHLNCHHRFFVMPAFAELLARFRRDGIRVVAHLHSIFTVDDSLRKLVEAVDAVIVHSVENQLEILAHGIRPDKLHLVPHGVHAVKQPDNARERAREAMGIAKGRKVITTFGFIQPHKGMESVVEAVQHLTARGVDACGYIVGDTKADDPYSGQYAAELRRLVQQAGLESKITFVDGFVPEEQVDQYLVASDVVMMNYHSQYHESSGACARALGMGALVAASTAPAFRCFGDAVWRITPGFPPGLSVEVLLSQQHLRDHILQQAARYREQHQWSRIGHLVAEVHRELGFQSVQQTKETVVETRQHAGGPGGHGTTLRVLMQNRPNAFTQRGGDTVVMERLSEELQAQGIEVVIDHGGRADIGAFDVVHLFNFATPDYTRQLAERAHQRGIPYVVTTLYEDVPMFHTQSHAVAAWMTEYVQRGQDRQWADAHRVAIENVPPSPRFDNEWTAAHAAMLFTSGRQETAVVQRDYPNAAQAVEVPFGCDLLPEQGRDLFVNRYGISDFILCVGRIESRKNQLMVLKALEDVDLPVVLVGGGHTYQPDYDQAVRSFRRKGQTLVLDWLAPEELASAYAAARVHVLGSWYELPGLVSLEAARYGANIVATDRGSTSDYLGEHAFYCEPHDERSIRNAVMAAYYSPVSPDLTQVPSAYTWERAASKTAELYQRVCGKTLNSAVSQTPAAMEAAVQESPEFKEFFEKGEAAAKSRDYEAAHQYFAKAEAVFPTSSRLLRSRGAVYLAQNKTDEARPYLERAIEIDPDTPKNINGLGMCEIRSGNAAAALPLLLRANEMEPTELVTILQLIECSYILERFEELEYVLRRYLEHHPDDLEMQFCLAGCLYRLERHGEAEEINKAVLASKPLHEGATELRRLLAETPRVAPREAPRKALQRQPNAERAASQAVPSVASAPTVTQNELGRFTGPFAEAPDPLANAAPQEKPSSAAPAEQPPVPSFTASHAAVAPRPSEREVPAAPAFNEIDSTLAMLEDEKKRRNFEKVRKECERLRQTTTLSEEQRDLVELLLAEVHVLTNDPRSAHAMYDLVLSRNQSNPRALCGKGALAAHNSEWETAERLFITARNTKPNYDVPIAGLGFCAARQGNHEDAWELYHRALSVNPENTSALLGLIDLAYLMQRLPELELKLREYLEFHPADVDMMYALAGCCFAQQKLHDASQEIEKIMIFNPAHQHACELREMIEGKQQGASAAV